MTFVFGEEEHFRISGVGVGVGEMDLSSSKIA
jgi:hypothetical protein